MWEIFFLIAQLKSLFKSDILLIDERGELEGQDRQFSQLVGRDEWSESYHFSRE